MKYKLWRYVDDPNFGGMMYRMWDKIEKHPCGILAKNFDKDGVLCDEEVYSPDTVIDEVSDEDVAAAREITKRLEEEEQ